MLSVQAKRVLAHKTRYLRPGEELVVFDGALVLGLGPGLVAATNQRLLFVCPGPGLGGRTKILDLGYDQISGVVVDPKATTADLTVDAGPEQLCFRDLDPAIAAQLAAAVQQAESTG